MSLSPTLICLMACIAMVHSDVPANCLGCLCEASTNGCNRYEGCHSSGGYYCGPFLISRGYWLEAQKPVDGVISPGITGSFEACTQDISCAIATINGYMRRFQKDCDGDGVVSCSDYVRIHKFGPYSCNQQLSGLFRDKYEACAARFQI